MENVLFCCVFCGSGTKPVMVREDRVACKCLNCNLIHFYQKKNEEWKYEHSEVPKEAKEAGKNEK